MILKCYENLNIWTELERKKGRSEKNLQLDNINMWFHPALYARRYFNIATKYNPNNLILLNAMLKC